MQNRPRWRSKGRSAERRQITIRMYRHGLGDCFLLRFPTRTGGTYSVLIDCGLIAVATDPKTMMERVARDITETCNGRLNLAVMTHEHWDHASGFSTQQAQSIFDSLAVEEVWYAWTEDPDNKLGRRLRQERESKLRALHLALGGLSSVGTPLALRRADALRSLLNFFGGADPLGAAAGAAGKTRLAFDYLGQRKGIRRRYCHPSDQPVSLPGVPGMRVFALGPPEDEGLLKRSSPTKKGAEVYEFASDLAFEESVAAAFDRYGGVGALGAGDRDCPFDSSYRRVDDRPDLMSPALAALISSQWNARGNEWRQITDDWTAAAESLALNLDKHTNNTCLVLAFELEPGGRVLLFPADAQVGNWLSWQSLRWTPSGGSPPESVTGPELLRRTVFYKAGHHGSHNATLRALGLEQMTSPDLIAFLPVFKAQAVKSGWTQMPFDPLVQRLRQKTGGRVVFSDDAAPSPDAGTLEGLSVAKRDAFLERLSVGPDGLYYEFALDA